MCAGMELKLQLSGCVCEHVPKGGSTLLLYLEHYTTLPPSTHKTHTHTHQEAVGPRGAAAVAEPKSGIDGSHRRLLDRWPVTDILRVSLGGNTAASAPPSDELSRMLIQVSGRKWLEFYSFLSQRC